MKGRVSLIGNLSQFRMAKFSGWVKEIMSVRSGTRYRGMLVFHIVAG